MFQPLYRLKFRDMALKYKLLNGNRFRPYRATPGSAGIDLYLPRDCVCKAGTTQKIRLDIAVEIPTQYHGALKDKSSVAQDGLHVVAGVIDNDYRGCIAVLLHNLNKTDVNLSAGQPVCQLILKQVVCVDIEEVESLTPTERGEGGFGSTHDENYEPRRQ